MKKVFIFLLTISHLFAEESPFAIYLTWHSDPTSTMCVNVIEEGPTRPISIEYQKKKSKRWKKASPSSLFSEEPFSIYSFNLTHLKPDTSYRFRVNGYSVQHLFSTMPSKLKKPLSFITGGDINLTTTSGPLFEETSRQAASRNPAFAVIGGDLACSGSNPKHTPEDDKRWFTWFSIWYKTMITDTGRIIPLLVSIGNHDVSGGHRQTPQKARLFYKFFRTENEMGYCVARFGSYLSLYLLDSDHTAPIKGLQSLWLAEQMFFDKKIPHRIAIYHISAYPPVRSNNYESSPSIRRYWVPIFDAFRLHLAFEHHDHAYKRTSPMSSDAIDPFGVVYVGNGPWGKYPRDPKKNRALFEACAQTRGFCEVTIRPKSRDIQAFNFDGTLIDSFSQQTDDLVARRLVEQERKLLKTKPAY